jgi:hypothetical protein
MSDHSHRFTIADEQTVQFYLDKLSAGVHDKPAGSRSFQASSRSQHGPQ